MPQKKCRICLNNGLLTNIFNTRAFRMISKDIMSLAKVEIYPGDGLPNTICSKCLKKLDDCIEFVLQCEKSDHELRALLIEHKNINEETQINDDMGFENINFPINNDISKFSPKSETNGTLSIDENICNNISITDTILNEDCILKQENDDKDIGHDDTKIKLSIRKAQKEQCFTCGKVMSSRFRLKTHLRTHTGERPYSCLHCSKNFSIAENLKVHMRIHTGEKPLQCSICGASFAQSAGLAAHRRKHTGQTPYQCTLCPRSFRTIGHLQYHIRRHTGEKNFECDTCKRAFITRSDLKQHLHTHTGDKPHVCCVCGLRVTRASHLTRHIRHTHDGEKPFSCTLCPSKFTQKGDFERHKKKHLSVTLKNETDIK